MKTINVGIVGYGKVGSGSHKRWINKRSDAELAAVCDTTAVRRAAAKEENPGAVIYEDYDDLIGNPNIDLIVITTPPNSHKDLSLRASAAGKHVFVDKPFALNLAEAEEMLSAAAAASRVIHCHQSRRYDPEYTRIVQLISSGRIGKIEHIRRVWAQYGEGWATWGIEGFNPTWRIQREFGGGMVYDYAPHCGDQILRLVDDELVSIFADVRALKFSDEVDDHFSCMFRFKNGATAYLEASNMAQLAAPHWYVIGSEGCITSEEVKGTVTLKRTDSEPELFEPIAQIDDLYDNLIAACNGEADPNVTPKELRDSMRMIDAIFESAKSGGATVLGM